MLQHDGTTVEQTLDMSPGWERGAMGGPVTFVGMYEALDVIALAADMDEMEVVLHPVEVLHLHRECGP